MCLFKIGACLIHVHFNMYAFSANGIHVWLIQVTSSLEVTTKFYCVPILSGFLVKIFLITVYKNNDIF